MGTWNGYLDMNDSPDVEVWATAISTNSTNGRRIIFRYAKKLRPSFDRSVQPDRIIIVWKYVSENGQPNPDEHSDMNQLEDALERVLQGSQVATLALVSTDENLREWAYYAQMYSSNGSIWPLKTCLHFRLKFIQLMIQRGVCIRGSEVIIRRPKLRHTAPRKSAFSRFEMNSLQAPFWAAT